MWTFCLTLFCHILIANCVNKPTTCAQNLPKLRALPGHGWDSIRNVQMGAVLNYTYEQCRTTDDGKYLVPDNTHVIAINDSNLRIMSEFIGHYMNYSSVVTTNIGLDVFGVTSVQNSYDKDFLEAKRRQVKEKSQTIRIQARNEIYAIRSSSDAKIDARLKSMLDRVIDETQSNNFHKAELLCQFIVRDYGTHYIHQTHAGAVFLQEDYISNNFVSRSGADERQISTAAGASFLKRFPIDKYSYNVEPQLLQQYEASRTSFDIRSVGGAGISSNNSLDDWRKQIGHNLAVVDRSGKALSHLLTPARYPNISIDTLNTVRKQLDQVVEDYYAYNTHFGCTDVNSPSFDYNANADNKDCRHPPTHYVFGAGFMTCTSSSTDAGDLCANLSVKNPLTGDLRCEDGYEAIPLTNNSLSSSRLVTVSSEECSGWWFWRKCRPVENDVIKYSAASHRGFWCVFGGGASKNNTGAMFGGLFTPWMNNSVGRGTGRGCPVSYVGLRLASDLYVCVSNFYEVGYGNSAPFGGFFSCRNGNPLATGLRLSTANGGSYLRGCPSGYSQRLVVVDNGCEIRFCVKLVSAVRQISVVLPPFRSQLAV